MAATTTEKEFLDAYDAFADAIFRHCFLRVHDREQAKDLLQETFVRTWDYIAEGNTVDSLKAFLFKVANNLIVDFSRKKKESSLNDMREAGFEPSDGDDDRVRNSVDAWAAARAVATLDEPYREAVMLRYLQGLHPREIADIVEETPNVVSVRIHRGVQQLREKLGYEEFL